MTNQEDPDLERPAPSNPNVDRYLVERLLQDENLSYREVARRAGCSDWIVRRIARQLTGDHRPMKLGSRNAESSGGGWILLAMLAACAILGIGWFRAQGGPPPGGRLVS